MIRPFDSARGKLTQAQEHIRNAENILQTFFETRPYHKVIQRDTNLIIFTKPRVKFKIVLCRSIPDKLAYVVADAVLNLRAALDHCISSSAFVAFREATYDDAFPFSKDAIKWEDKLKGRVRVIELHPLLRTFQPYKGGNDFLWAINEVANRDKHSARFFNPLQTTAAIKAKLIGRGFEFLSNAAWDGEKDEIVFLTAPEDARFHYDFEISAFVSFYDLPVVDCLPVPMVLHKMAGIVEGILLAVEAEMRRLYTF
jgi:hypothetical protein